jgi:hypothetical protein
MNDTARDIQTVEAVSTEGMDDLYSQTENSVEPSDNRMVLTVAEASSRLGVPLSTLYRRIKAKKYETIQGEDGAVRIVLQAENSSENQVVTAFELIENQTESITTPDSRFSKDENHSRQTFQNPDMAALLELVAEKDRKLEAATYRLGYLESQLEGKDREIKLLTDSQHKTSWWQRFKAFFVKQ